MGTSQETWACKGKDLLSRAKHAGLEIEVAKAEPGKATLYRIIKDEFHQEGEEWRPNIFDTEYEISSKGRYRNATNKKLVYGQQQPDGYIRTFLKVSKGKYTSIAMHRIVFFSFNPDLFEERDNYVIDHIDGRRDNNTLSNLRPLSIAKNNEVRVENRNKSQEILTQLILKFGYEETLNKLKRLLYEGE